MKPGLISSFLLRLFGGAPEVPSPPNILDMEDIDYDEQTGTLSISNITKPFWLQTNPYNTNSMDGFFDTGHAPILVGRETLPDEYLRIGTIVAWEKDGISRFHQIVKTGTDNDGWYCRTAGINLGAMDEGKLRKDDIKWICLGVLFTKTSTKILYAT